MKNKDLTIVGIGASAGGLEALQGFVSNLPTNTNIGYILAQHLSPTYKSMLVDLLSKDSTIKIKEAQNQELIEADTMYICPPNKNIIIEDDKILIFETKQLTYGPKPSINILFESIAAHKENKAIGIILSGTGSDGSLGIRAIKAEGGFTIVQQPQSSKYDGMPNSAINTGNVDIILDVEVMGKEIVELLKYPDRQKSLQNFNDKTLIYRNILARLQKSKKIDFSLYKSSTIQRRIERRMVALKITDISDYYSFIMQETNSEVEELFKDILIGVTAFFRDEEAFKSLEEHLRVIIPKKEDKHIHIWIPGCSTGEEAYSIAMLLSEILGPDIANYKVQIFATDIDDEATKYARMGRYPESTLLNMDKNYIKKYFMTKQEEYEVIKPIREMCIFSRHDITNDPAFMRLDLVSCRNLLIYFTNELQQRIFPMFHYSLADNGILFLGKSESIGNFGNLFTTIDKKHRVYRANYLGKRSAPMPLRIFQPKAMHDYRTQEKESAIPTVSDMMISHIQRHIFPMCIVVNSSFDLVFIKGENPYLKRPEGEITQNIFKNVIDEISVELRAALHQCKKEATLIKTDFEKVIIDKETKYVRFIVSPLDNSLTNDLFLICFQEEEYKNIHKLGFFDSNSSTREQTEALELELSRTKEHLQTVIEELETSNEEMQSLNEELQSSNEELQSSNEELETTNEELQSTNEELQTAYSEMRAMYEQSDYDNKQIKSIRKELEESSIRLSSVINSANTGVLDVDLDKNKTLYVSEKWGKIFGYDPYMLEGYHKNLGEWLLEQTHPDDKESLERLNEEVFLGKKDKFTLELRIKHKNTQYIWVKMFLVAIMNQANNKAIRTISTLNNINDIKLKSLQNDAAHIKLENATKIAKIGTWEYDVKTQEIWWSDEMHDIYELPLDREINLEELEGIIHKDDRQNHQELLQASIDNKKPLDIVYRIKTDDKIRYVWGRGDFVKDEDTKYAKLVGVVQDVTKHYADENWTKKEDN